MSIGLQGLWLIESFDAQLLEERLREFQSNGSLGLYGCGSSSGACGCTLGLCQGLDAF